MKNLFKLSFVFALLAGISFAQTQLTITTLSAAVTSKKSQVIPLTSGTGVTAGTDLIIDNEVVQVTAVPSVGSSFPVIRGYNATRGAFHASGAPVVVVPPAAQGVAIVSYDMAGACARGSSTTAQSTTYLPVFNYTNGKYFDCLGGYWAGGVPLPLANAPSLLLNIDPGDTVYTSVNTNGVALAATTDAYCAEIDIPSARWLTGMQTLNGTSVATDSRILSLYDASGYLLASTPTLAAGSYGSASEYGGGAFSQLYVANAGAYFACVQPKTSAGTASVRMALTQHNDFIKGGIVTITAGKANATITVPTTFTSAQTPYLGVY